MHVPVPALGAHVLAREEGGNLTSEREISPNSSSFFLPSREYNILGNENLAINDPNLQTKER